MKNNLRFSIIIPTYRSESTLQRCLGSIIEQTYIDFEILIIDALSKDKTLKIAQGYNDPRIKIFSESDNGIYDAMNKGIKLAKGDWLYFLGSDDYLFGNDVLERIFNVINQTKRKIIYGNVKIQGNAGWATDGQIYDGIFDLKKLLEQNICHQAIFYNKVVFTKIERFNVNYKICADYDFNLKCRAHYHFLYVDFIVAIFKGGNTSVSMVDENFSNDFWINIVNYYRWRLFNPVFSSYSKQLAENTQNHFYKLLIQLSVIVNQIISALKFIKRKIKSIFNDKIQSYTNPTIPPNSRK